MFNMFYLKYIKIYISKSMYIKLFYHILKNIFCLFVVYKTNDNNIVQFQQFLPFQTKNFPAGVEYIVFLSLSLFQHFPSTSISLTLQYTGEVF